MKLEENVFCSQCKQIQEHVELKQFYTLPQNFIIALNWRDINPYSVDSKNMNTNSIENNINSEHIENISNENIDQLNLEPIPQNQPINVFQQQNLN